MTFIKEILAELEKLAPLPYQEDYDNAGLLVGAPDTEVTGILFTLDITEDIVEEAIRKQCNLIVAHHPVIFKGLKKLNGKNYVERTVIKAIKNDIALYATHTNIDHVTGGVNWQIANRLGLQISRYWPPKGKFSQSWPFSARLKTHRKYCRRSSKQAPAKSANTGIAASVARDWAHFYPVRMQIPLLAAVVSWKRRRNIVWK